MSPLLVLALTQAAKPVHPTHAPLVVDASPVTAHEAREAFSKVATLLLKVNGRPLGTPGIPDSGRPATRGEIVGEMARLYGAAEPTFRFTPAPVRYDAGVFRIDAAQSASLAKLVMRGCVGRIGPLAVGPEPGLTPKQFGDALGFFVARLAQMSHLPSPKWTPALQEG